MKESACECWIELSDRAALGEVLSNDEARFEREHRASCAACAAESRVWAAMEQCLSDGSVTPRLLDPSTPTPPVRRRWRRWAVAAAAAAVVAAIGVLVGSSWSRPEASAPNVAPTRTDARINLVLVSGDVSVRGAQAATGAALRPSDVVRVGRGRACLSYSGGTSACAAENTALRLVAAKEEQRLMLDAGAIVCRLDAPPLGVRFSVDTPRGRVTAKGTVFAVEHLASSEVAVRLHRGVVELETPSGTRRELRAPAAAAMGKTIRRLPTTGEAWHADAQLIESADLWADGAVAPVDIVTRPTGAKISLDGVLLGTSPVSTLLGRGGHELVVEREGLAPHRKHFVVQGAERISLAPLLLPAPKPSATAVPTVAANPQPGSAPPTAAELLGQARTLRAAGRYAEAANRYQWVLNAHRGSAEARAALISLGELQLSQLGRPAAALRSFDAYLSGGGALVQEARYGRIRALRQLGRTEQARREGEQFVRDYPGSAQATSLRERNR